MILVMNEAEKLLKTSYICDLHERVDSRIMLILLNGKSHIYLNYDISESFKAFQQVYLFVQAYDYQFKLLLQLLSLFLSLLF